MNKENVIPSSSIELGAYSSKISVNGQFEGLEFAVDDILQSERHRFEEELLTCDQSSDPIDVWEKYLKWTKQHFCREGNSSDYVDLLAKFIAKFLRSSQYRNDPRYVNAWLTTAQTNENPEEIFSFMRNQGIGIECASFYVAWADEYEKCSNFERAKAVYELGKKNQAQPAVLLSKMSNSFDVRLSKNGSKFQPNLDVAVATRPDTTLRMPLKSIPPKDTNNCIQQFASITKPVELPCSTDILASNTLATSLNDVRNVSWLQEETNSIPVPSSDRSKIVCETDVTDTLADLMPLPKDVEEMLTRYEEFPPTESASHKAIRVSNGDTDVNQVQMYPVSKIYSELGEFQLEEVVAAKWRRSKSESEKQLRRLIVEEKKEKKLKQVQEKFLTFKKENEALKNEKEALRKEKEAAQHKLMRKQKQLSEIVSLISSKFSVNEKPVQLENKDMTVKVESLCSQLKNIKKSDKQHTQNDVNHKQQPIALLDAVREVPLPSAKQNYCYIKNGSLNQSNSSLNHSKLSQASPTVCTKQAMGDIMDMFQKPLDFESHVAAAEAQVNIDSSEENFNTSVVDRPCSQPTAKFALFHDISTSNRLDHKHENKPSQKTLLKTTPFPESTPPNKQEDSEKSATNQPSLQGVAKFSIFCDEPTSVSKQVDCGSLNQKPWNYTDISNQQSEYHADVPNSSTKFSVFHDGANNQEAFLNDTAIEKAQLESSQDKFATSLCNSDPDFSMQMSFGAHKISAESTSYWQTGLMKLETPVGTSHLPDNKAISSNINEDPPQESKKLSPILEASNESDKSVAATTKSHLSTQDTIPTHKSFLHPPTVNRKPLTHISSVKYNENQSQQELSVAPSYQALNVGDSMNFSIFSDLHLQKSSGIHPFNIDADLNNSSLSELLGENTEFSSPVRTTCNDEKFSSFMPCSPNLKKALLLQNSSAKLSSETTFCDTAASCSASVKESNVSLQKLSLNDNVASRTNSKKLNIVKDPWNDTILQEIIKVPSNVEQVIWINADMPRFRKGSSVQMGAKHFSIVDTIGQGAFAKVYLVSDGLKKQHAVKVEMPPFLWEVFILQEAKHRLHVSNRGLFCDMLMDVESTIMFNNASCIVCKYLSHGTLLDYISHIHSTRMPFDHISVIASQILTLVNALHSIDIIHGDIKPDNFLVCSEFKSGSSKIIPPLKLIDFGRAIDMCGFPKGTAFTRDCGTSGFICSQMKLKQPWNYHIDYTGIAGTLYVVLTNSYMATVQDKEGKWKTINRIPRCAGKSWHHLFETLLNYPTPSDKWCPTYRDSPLPSLIELFCTTQV